MEYAIQPATGFEGRGSSMHGLLEVNGIWGWGLEFSNKAPARAAGRHPPLAPNADDASPTFESSAVLLIVQQVVQEIWV